MLYRRLAKLTITVWNQIIILRRLTTIFPKRKIGYLKSGYEASFLVLDGNPLTNFEAVKKIRLRFKQGFMLPNPVVKVKQSDNAKND